MVALNLTQNPHIVLLVSKVLTCMSATMVLGSKLGLNPEHRMDVNSVAQQLESVRMNFYTLTK